MNDRGIDISQVGVLEGLVGAIALYFALKLIRRTLNAYIRKRQLDPLINRFLPLVEFFCWMLFLVWGAGCVFQTGTAGFITLLILTLAIVTWIAHITLKDWIAGVMFKAEAQFDLGDTLAIGENNGRLKRLGYRTLILETPTGAFIEIPYSHLAKQSHIEKIPTYNTHCIFEMEANEPSVPEEFLQLVRSVVLSAPWCSLTRHPQIRLMGRQDNRLWVEVNAYVLHERYAHHLETYVKRRFPVAGEVL
jgi:small-conductance mechanosensitive channel